MFVNNGLTYTYEIKLFPGSEYNGETFYTNSIDKAEAKYEEYSWYDLAKVVMKIHDNTMDLPKILRRMS